MKINVLFSRTPGVLQAIVKLKSRVEQWSAQECVGVSNPLYVAIIIIIYALTHLMFPLEGKSPDKTLICTVHTYLFI